MPVFFGRTFKTENGKISLETLLFREGYTEILENESTEYDIRS